MEEGGASRAQQQTGLVRLLPGMTGNTPAPSAVRLPGVTVASTSGSDALQVEEKGAAVAGRRNNRLRGVRSRPSTPHLSPTSPGPFYEAGRGAGPLEVVPSGGDAEPDSSIGYERIAEASRVLRESNQDSQRRRGRRREHGNNTSSGEESNGILAVVVSIGTTAFLGFGLCWLNTMVVWVSCCVCKRRRPGQGSANSNGVNQQMGWDDGVIRATVCGTLASVVCVADGANIADGDELPVSHAFTSRLSSAGGPTVVRVDRYGIGRGESSNVGPFLSRRFLNAVPADYPSSGVSSESSFPEFCSERREQGVFQVSGNTPEDEKAGEEELKCNNINNTTTVAASHRFSLFYSDGRSGRGEAETTPTTTRMSWKFCTFPRFWRASHRDGSGGSQASPDEEGARSPASNSAVADVGGVKETQVGEGIGQQEARTVSVQAIKQGERRSDALAGAKQIGETAQGNRTEGSLGASEDANASPSDRTTTTSPIKNARAGSKTFLEKKPRGDVTITCRKVFDPDGMESALRRGDCRSGVASPDLPRARPMWRAFSEVDHDRIKENHSRATQRHLSRLST